ncbi:MAG: energy transducer TonB [Candidatus Aminicenantes bacterium]|nr:energy transducer TonB [Candidatus Aminicenantes bacterium]
MFNASLFEPEAGFGRKVLVFPAAVAIHAAVIAALIVVPLIKAGAPPDVPDVVDVIFAAPAPPPLPPAKKGPARPGRTKIKPVQARPAAAPGRLVAPVDIPKDIEDAALPDFAGDGEGGVEWGIEGGAKDGVFSGIVGPVIDRIVNTIEGPEPPVAVVRPPRLVKAVAPVYPEIAREARIEGDVVVEAVTDVYGRVVRVRVLRSIAFLDEAAVDAVRQWIYEPMVINGKPRAVLVNVTVRFELK